MERRQHRKMVQATIMAAGSRMMVLASIHGHDERSRGLTPRKGITRWKMSSFALDRCSSRKPVDASLAP